MVVSEALQFALVGLLLYGYRSIFLHIGGLTPAPGGSLLGYKLTFILSITFIMLSMDLHHECTSTVSQTTTDGNYLEYQLDEPVGLHG